MKESIFTYKVAKMVFDVHIDKDDELNNYLQPYLPFSLNEKEANCVFNYTILPETVPATVDEDWPQIANFNEEGQQMTLYKSNQGEYGILMTLEYDKEGKCLLIINNDFTQAKLATNGNIQMRIYGMNSGLMMMFAFAGATRHTLLIHSSVIKKDERGYLFLGKSGTGKSTHSGLWLKHIEGTELLNDDNPALGLDERNIPTVYGTPWSGKTPCYRNIKAKIGGFVNLHQAPSNEIMRLNTIMAYAALLPAISNMKWERKLSDGVNDTINQIICQVPVLDLKCLPDEEAARMSYKALTQTQI